MQYCILVRNHLQGLVLLCTEVRRWETLLDDACTFIAEGVHLPVREPGYQVDRLQRHDLSSATLPQSQCEIFEYVRARDNTGSQVNHSHVWRQNCESQLR
jgi:hypothetical protein